MNRRAWTLMAMLAALWGASYLFIKIALEDLSPGMIVFVRVALAALVLVPLALARDAFAPLRGRLGAVALLAIVQVAGPFLLISFGEQHITSSLTGILVASAPIFTAILAVWVAGEERASGTAVAGIAIGMAGVALLLGVDTGGAIGGALMVVLASLGYAIGAFMLKHGFRDAQPVGMAAATMVASAIMVLPLAIATAPDAVPGLGTSAAMVALGAGGTGIAFYLFYTLISEVGPQRAAVVAYIAPGFAVAYGVTLLDEPATVATVAGLALIVGGSWLAAEGRLPRRGARDAPAGAGIPSSPNPPIAERRAA